MKFFTELFLLKKFLVSFLKLLFGCMYKVEIACVDTSQECAGQVWIWLWSIDFDKVAPLEMTKKIWNFQFPFSNFYLVEIAGLMIFDSYPPWR
jgi:hypothetical protein